MLLDTILWSHSSTKVISGDAKTCGICVSKWDEENISSGHEFSAGLDFLYVGDNRLYANDTRFSRLQHNFSFNTISQTEKKTDRQIDRQTDQILTIIRSSWYWHLCHDFQRLIYSFYSLSMLSLHRLKTWNIKELILSVAGR